MRFNIEKSALSSSLALVNSVTERKNTIPILKNVKLEIFDNKLQLSTTDMDILSESKIKTLCASNGQTTVPAQLFYDIVKKIPDDKEITIVYASSKHAKLFKNLVNKQIFCLVGNEGFRLEDAFDGDFIEDAICVLPPYPRHMGTYIPNIIEKKAFELEKYDYTELKIDSHTSIALQVIKKIMPNMVYVVGYDGYKNATIDQKAQELLEENNALFKDFSNNCGIELVSLFETVYKLPQTSIYSIV